MIFFTKHREIKVVLLIVATLIIIGTIIYKSRKDKDASYDQQLRRLFDSNIEDRMHSQTSKDNQPKNIKMSIIANNDWEQSPPETNSNFRMENSPTYNDLRALTKKLTSEKINKLDNLLNEIQKMTSEAYKDSTKTLSENMSYDEIEKIVFSLFQNYTIAW